MGRLTAGMLVAVFAALVFTASAGAAEIPPTKECTATFSKLLANYAKHSDGSVAAQQRANRKFANGLAKGDCVSDAEPLLKWVKPAPFTEQCVEGAKQAESVWAPVSDRLRKLTRQNRADQRRMDKQTRRIGKRIRKLRQADASPKRIRALERRQLKLIFKSLRLGFKYLDDMFVAVEPKAASNSLVLFELISRRCIGGKTFHGALTGTEKNNQPVARAIRKNQLMLSFSILAAAFDGVDGASASSVSGVDLKQLPRCDSGEQTPVSAALPSVLCANGLSIRAD